MLGELESQVSKKKYECEDVMCVMLLWQTDLMLSSSSYYTAKGIFGKILPPDYNGSRSPVGKGMGGLQ